MSALPLAFLASYFLSFSFPIFTGTRMRDPNLPANPAPAPGHLILMVPLSASSAPMEDLPSAQLTAPIAPPEAVVPSLPLWPLAGLLQLT